MALTRKKYAKCIPTLYVPLRVLTPTIMLIIHLFDSGNHLQRVAQNGNNWQRVALFGTDWQIVANLPETTNFADDYPPLCC